MKLVERIVKKGDRLALREFHDNRTVFHHRGGKPLRFAEYVDILRKEALPRWSTRRNKIELAEEAYELTVERFNNIPLKEHERASRKDNGSSRRKGRGGPDCRFYFNAFLKHVDKEFQSRSPSSDIEKEERAARYLTTHVLQNFKRSCKESDRRSELATRYFWKIEGKSITLWLPTYIKGRERGHWLEKNIKGPDPSRPGERQRIQNIIDTRLPRGKIIPISEGTMESSSLLEREPSPSWSQEHDISVEGLAGVVAREKAENIEHQRPAIRALGKEKLMELIFRIFDDLSHEEYRDGEIACCFGLNKATFSRFAGSQWLKPSKEGKISSIPDLWSNTAQILASNPTFVKATKEAGVWKRVQSTIGIPEIEDKDDVR